ncbi:hypothetical protein EYF80_018374 [Liparis tanakae]|uniref:Uncharacterized protein n=1 Tax=Liparis tanakae TaxID=230148 RepID=A0A4Z2I1P0_9TELE|nr:hypothetical protein EYF80_018374 [Liparis tanakae]
MTLGLNRNQETCLHQHAEPTASLLTWELRWTTEVWLDTTRFGAPMTFELWPSETVVVTVTVTDVPGGTGLELPQSHLSTGLNLLARSPSKASRGQSLHWVSVASKCSSMLTTNLPTVSVVHVMPGKEQTGSMWQDMWMMRATRARRNIRWYRTDTARRACWGGGVGRRLSRRRPGAAKEVSATTGDAGAPPARLAALPMNGAFVKGGSEDT